MPQKRTAAGKVKPKSKVKVVANRPSAGGVFAKLQTRSGMLAMAVTFVIIGTSALSWVNAATTTSSLWSTSAVPKTITASDNQSVELGVKFRAQYTGQVQSMRFYKGPQNTGIHTGSLWSSDGHKLASVTFKNETASGWQTAVFAQPVPIAANTTYTASYFAPKGRYAVSQDYFKKALTNGPLTALKDGTDSGNGVFTYAKSSVYPKDSYKSSNYWVDVVFSTKRFNPTPLPAVPTKLTAGVNGKNVTLSWTDSATTGVSYYEITRDGVSIGKNETGAGYVDANLTAGKTYAYQVRAVDAAGQKSGWSNTAKAIIPADPVPVPDPPQPTNPTPSAPSASTCPLPTYPTPSCAGFRTDTALQTVSGGMVVTTPGQVIENKFITGTIDIRAQNVVIRNSSITGGVINDSTATRYHFTIEDSTVGPATGCSTFGNGGIGVSDYTARRVVVHNFPDGFRVAGSNITIEDSYVKLCSDNPEEHSDGIQAYGAINSNNITINHNTIDQTSVTNGAATAPIFLPGGTDNSAVINITNNLLAGGGYTLRAYGAGMQFPAITGNKIVDGHWEYGPLDITCNNIGSWSGNAVVTANLATGQVLGQVRALNDCN